MAQGKRQNGTKTKDTKTIEQKPDVIKRSAQNRAIMVTGSLEICIMPVSGKEARESYCSSTIAVSFEDQSNTPMSRVVCLNPAQVEALLKLIDFDNSDFITTFYESKK